MSETNTLKDKSQVQPATAPVAPATAPKPAVPKPAVPATGSSDISSLSDEDKEIFNLVYDYCPYVHFHPDEKYMPTSFSYLLDNVDSFETLDGSIEFDPVTDKTKIANIIKAKQVTDKKGQNHKIIGNNSNGKFLLNIGHGSSKSGYDGEPNPKNRLYGGGMNNAYIYAYTLGDLTAKDGTKFLDVVYTIYFMWNGTIDYHAWDAEEITLRFQKNSTTGSDAYNTGYKSQMAVPGNEQSCDNYYLKRVACSAHGNIMLFPTGFSSGGGDVEFYVDEKGNKTKHPLLYSALGSHPPYTHAGVQKRIMGFGSDETAKGPLWKPNIHFNYNTWIKKDSTSKCSELKENLDDAYYILGTNNFKKSGWEETLSFFTGSIGNKNNNQNTIPFKGGVLNIISDGDFYYKFQKGGVEAAVSNALDVKKQKLLANILGSLCLLLIVVVIMLNIFRPKSIVMSFIPLFCILLTLFGSIAVFLVFVGSAFNNKSLKWITTNLGIFIPLAVFIMIGVFVVVPIVGRKILIHK